MEISFLLRLLFIIYPFSYLIRQAYYLLAKYLNFIEEIIYLKIV